MVNITVNVNNPSGLHLRPAGVLCETALKFKSRITFQYNGGEGTANAKSILSILGACVKCGDTIELICEGEDEVQALECLSELVKNGLGE